MIPQTLGDGPVMIDPFGEGVNNYGMFAVYRGHVYIGPADADNAVYRIKPDGSDPEIVSLVFHNDSTSQPEIAYTLDPGPDDETGIDCIAGGVIDGQEYLFVGPAKGDKIDYFYYTSGSGSTLHFHEININPMNRLTTGGVSSMIVFNNSLYVGYSEFGGNRPRAQRYINIVQSPVEGVDMIELDADDMPRIGLNATPNNGAATVCAIDSFGLFNNQLYLANGGSSAVDADGGIVRSTTDSPLDYMTYPGDWADETPVAVPEWYNSPLNDRFSIELTTFNKLVPADRAFPDMAEFNNKLYVIRNTTTGPQLWKHDGASWMLVADNGTGITDMGNANNTSAALLVANGDRLYIGFDNAVEGVHLWRTTLGVTDPTIETDFEPVSIDGFGDPANNQRLYNGLSISSGGVDYLWLLSGKSGGNVNIYRTSN
jgi:hypothetical protein